MGSHDSHAAHEPKSEAEPRTPMWLPALGIFLFLVGGVYFVTQNAPEGGETAKATTEATQAKPAAQPAPPGSARALQIPPTMRQPGPAGAYTMKLPEGVRPPGIHH